MDFKELKNIKDFTYESHNFVEDKDVEVENVNENKYQVYKYMTEPVYFSAAYGARVGGSAENDGGTQRGKRSEKISWYDGEFISSISDGGGISINYNDNDDFEKWMCSFFKKPKNDYEVELI